MTKKTKKSDCKIIKGLAANCGKTRGCVKIVCTEKDLCKIKKGDVMVAALAIPWYLPAIKKAAAIITDEGGITCHAAVVSREMKVPCIVCTKNATEVLHDGDEIEVDADKGTVKILK